MQKKQRKLIISILVCVCYLCAIYAYKAEDYIERIDAIKKEKFEKGTKK